jgi:hypothetical protein
MQISPRLLKHLIVALCTFNAGLCSVWLLTSEQQDVSIAGPNPAQTQALTPILTLRCRPEYSDLAVPSFVLARLVGIEKKIIDINEKVRQLSLKSVATDAEMFINLEKVTDLTEELDQLTAERNYILNRSAGDDEGRAKLLYREVCF